MTQATPNPVRALTGWRWMVEGFWILKRAPMAMMVVVALFLFTLLLLAMPPGLGQVFSLVAWPGLLWGLMMSIQRILETGQGPEPALLYSGFRGPGGRPKPMLLLGLFNLVTSFTALLLAVLVTLSVDRAPWVAFAEQAMQPLSGTPLVMPTPPLVAALVFLLIYVPAQMLLWFAPLFVGRYGATAVKALFFSLVTTWRHKGAFIVFTISWFVVSAGLLNLSLLLPGALGSLLFSVASLVIGIAFYCSMWPTWRDTVIATEAGRAQTPPPVAARDVSAPPAPPLPPSAPHPGQERPRDADEQQADAVPPAGGDREGRP